MPLIWSAVDWSSSVGIGLGTSRIGGGLLQAKVFRSRENEEKTEGICDAKTTVEPVFTEGIFSFIK